MSLVDSRLYTAWLLLQKYPGSSSDTETYSSSSAPHLLPKIYTDVAMKRPHSSLSDKMHLRNGEHVSNFSGAPEEHVAKKVQSNGASKTHKQAATQNGDHEVLHTNGHSSKANEIRALITSDLTPDAVLDTVLAAWTILIHRYQRDVFHQFTWGAVDGRDRASQCINTTDIKFTSHQTAGSLKSQIGNVRSKGYDAHNATLFLNDGSLHEVLTDPSIFLTRLTCTSGLSKYHSEGKETLFSPLQDGRQRPCLATKPFRNFISLLRFLIPYSAILTTRYHPSFLLPKKNLMNSGAGIILYSQS